MSRIQKIVSQHGEIVRDLVQTLPGKAKSSGNRDWTLAVKQTSHDLCLKYLDSCKSEFWGTYRSCTKYQHTEWLLDAAWYVQEDTEEGLVLAVESEWADDNEEVRFDFSKLLTVKAPIKILIFQAGENSRNDRSKQISYLEELCCRWSQHTAGDKLYLLNFYDGKHEVHFAEVATSGSIPDFEFKLLGDLKAQDSVEGI